MTFLLFGYRNGSTRSCPKNCQMTTKNVLWGYGCAGNNEYVKKSDEKKQKQKIKRIMIIKMLGILDLIVYF